jgi:hypothetical protein
MNARVVLFVSIAAVSWIATPGCGGGGDGDAGIDADHEVTDADESDTDQDVETTTDGDVDGDIDSDTVELPAHAPAVLILDQELRHHSTWIDVIRAFESAGLDVSYRRFYPHLTVADVTPGDGGEVPYSVIVMAAGRFPGDPGSRMRLGELEPAARFVQEGGALLLAPASGQRNSYSGENDFFLFNRLLEELAVPVRIDRNTIIGEFFFDPALPHRTTTWSYATPLEFNIAYPYFVTPEEESLAGGNAPSLRVASDEVQVLLHTWSEGYLWLNLDDGVTEELIDFIDEELAVAALAQAGDAGGFVAVVPRGTLTVTSASTISDKPAMDEEREGVNRAWLGELAVVLRDLVNGERELDVTWSRDSDELFSVAAPGFDPIDPDGEVVEIASVVSELLVPDTPPSGELVEAVPDPIPGPRELPSWFSPGGCRLAYGSMTSELRFMATAFDEVVNNDIDILMTTTNPVRLTQLEGDELAAEREMYRTVGGMAEDAGARWFVGEHYVGVFLGTEPRAYPRMVGSHGFEADSPDPLSAGYWEDVLLPTCAAVGEVAGESPGIAGLHFDMELYGGPVWHHDGWAFSDDDARAFESAGSDADLARELVEANAVDRLDLLVDRGRLGEYFGTLEDTVAEYGRRCREAAREHAPDLELMLYNAGFPNTWFHVGLMRGLGTSERPVIVLTYDGWARRPTEALWAAGVDLVHLGGTIVSHWRPDQFEDVLVALARGNDGYWYFTFNDFSSTNAEPPPLHGDSGMYWRAVIDANDRLRRGD